MKKTIFLILLFSYLFMNGQTISNTDKYQYQYGTNVITRINPQKTKVVCYYEPNEHQRNFMVLYGNSRKYFSIDFSSSTSNNNSGINVKDLQIIGDICYFCGTRWRETGQWLYNYDGSIYMEVRNEGFIGKFNVNDVVNSGGNFEYLIIDETLHLDKIITCPHGILAIGLKKNSLESCIVELHPDPASSLPITYNYSIYTSPSNDEVFMDITNNNDTICVLSRFKNGIRPEAFKYFFGLRYGISTDFLNSNTGIYYYSTQNVLWDEAASFTGLDPIHICSFRTNKAVSISYLNTSLSSRQGFPILYKVNFPGANISKVLIGLDSYKYKTILDMEFAIPSQGNTYSAMLLEDINGNSVLRFPNWNITDPMPDTILYTQTYKLQSISPYQVADIGGLYVGGFDPNNSNEVLNFHQHLLNDQYAYWYTFTCLNKKIEAIESYNTNIEPIFEASVLNKPAERDHLAFESIPFKPQNIDLNTICKRPY